MTTAIDMFSGIGGNTEGARIAGVDVKWAGNHWPVAVEWHAANHPGTQHDCQDLRQKDWHQVPRHDGLMASSSCQGYSPARGRDQPRHDQYRSTSFAIIDCAAVHRPQFIVCENVKGMLGWVLWPAWRYALELLGYAVSTNILDAACFGVPQHRERLIVVATRSKAPLQLRPGRAQLRPIGPCIDWDQGEWGPINRRLCAATRARITAGRREFGERFVAPYYKSGSGNTGRSIERPLGVITTKARWRIVDGNRTRMMSLAEYRRGMGFRESYLLPSTIETGIHLLGNATPPPLMAGVLRQVLAA